MAWGVIAGAAIGGLSSYGQGRAARKAAQAAAAFNAKQARLSKRMATRVAIHQQRQLIMQRQQAEAQLRAELREVTTAAAEAQGAAAATMGEMGTGGQTHAYLMQEFERSQLEAFQTNIRNQERTQQQYLMDLETVQHNLESTKIQANPAPTAIPSKSSLLLNAAIGAAQGGIQAYGAFK